MLLQALCIISSPSVNSNRGLSGNIQFGSKLANFCPVWPWNLRDNLEKLDELTAHRQLKSPRSLSGISIHLTLVTKWSWSWSLVMVMHDLLPRPLCNVNLPSHSEIQLFQNMNFKIHGQGHVCGQRSRSRLTFKIQRSRLWSRSTPLVTFRAWCSIDMFAFPIFVAIVPLLAEI